MQGHRPTVTFKRSLKTLKTLSQNSFGDSSLGTKIRLYKDISLLHFYKNLPDCNDMDLIVRFMIFNCSKLNLSLYPLYYAKVCNEFAGPISASLRPGNTAPFEETL